MRTLLVPAVAFALIATPAMAGDIMSCSYNMFAQMQHGDMPMPPPGSPPPPMAGANTPPPPANGAMPPPPPAGKPGDAPQAGGAMPGKPPMPPMGMMMHPMPMEPGPTVEDKLQCVHGKDKMDASLTELAAKGWNLQSAIPGRGGVNFYLTK